MNSELTDWETFILRHREPGNLFVHLISWLMFMGGPLLALFTSNAWYLSLFFGSGAVGAFGHFVFKDSGVSLKEATSSKMVPVYVTRMLWSLAQRNYWPQVERAEARAIAMGITPVVRGS